jgi:predicted transcriptional regulator
MMGHLEADVMEILWAHGEASVHGVVELLARPLAYTTVMTTLDRLYKKGLLVRRKADRAFVYAPRLTRVDWERKRADEMLAEFPGELLISCLVDAVGQQDAALLDQLERRIRLKRKELERRKRS